MAESASFRSALAVPEFRALALARLISMLGDSAAFLAVTILVFQRTGSSLLASLTFAVAFVPYLFGGALLSASIDRFPARGLIVATDLLGALFIALLTLPAAPIWLIFLALFAIGSVAPIRAGAIDAVVASVLTGEAYVAGRSVQRMISQASQLVGIGFGGTLVAPLGARGALAADLATFLISAAIVRFGTPPMPASGSVHRSGMVADSLAGIG
jgi:MFS family permease